MSISLLPGGVGRDTFFVGGPTPRAVSGSGCMIRDEFGHEVIDANGNHTTLVHGNARPEVVEAAARAIRDGSCFGMPNLRESEHAEELLKRFDHFDRVRYANSGTEAVMTALRLARAVTGREEIVMLQGAYHGSSDTALVSGGPHYTRGIPQGTIDCVRIVSINDPESLREVFARHGSRIAAMIVDVMPNRAGLIGVTQEFLATAREVTESAGSLLILDEVISLRLGYSGVGAELGVVPDLITAAKYIGGGFPVGAVIGSSEVMRVLDPRQANAIPNAGTFTGNPVTMAAGLEALKLFTPQEIERINRLGTTIRERLDPVVGEFGWEMRGQGSLLRPYPAEGIPALEVQHRLWHAAYREGLLLTQNNLCALSTAMDEETAEEITTRLGAAVQSALG